MIENWWPVEIGYYDNPNHLDVYQTCLSMKDQIKSANNKFGICGSLFSDRWYDNSVRPEFGDIHDFIFQSVRQYIDETQMDFDFKRTEGWLNLYEKGDYQEYHEHNPSILSAVYFVNESNSSLCFNSPYMDQHIIKYQNDKLNTHESIWYKSIPGRCVVFRSYLLHCVSKHMDDNPRFSFAYNFFKNE